MAGGTVGTGRHEPCAAGTARHARRRRLGATTNICNIIPIVAGSEACAHVMCMRREAKQGHMDYRHVQPGSGERAVAHMAELFSLRLEAARAVGVRARAQGAFERAQHVADEARSAYDAVADRSDEATRDGSTAEEQFRELMSERARLRDRMLELARLEQAFLKSKIEADEACSDVADAVDSASDVFASHSGRRGDTAGPDASCDRESSPGQQEPSLLPNAAANARPFRCPCGDPLLEPLQRQLEPLLRRASSGQLLSHAEASALASGELSHGMLAASVAEGDGLAHAFDDIAHVATLSRALYQRAVSWALFSEEWSDALAAYLHSRGLTRVLEVAGGAGTLATPMRLRGLSWRCTDAHPSQVAEAIAPEAYDAQAALDRFGSAVDVVFWASWPRADVGDASLAEECVRRRLPTIFVGEPKGGCTGSDRLWELPTLYCRPLSGGGACSPAGSTHGSTGSGGHMSDAPLASWDVPRWPGLRDRTWIIEAQLDPTAVRNDTTL